MTSQDWKFGISLTKPSDKGDDGVHEVGKAFDQSWIIDQMSRNCQRPPKPQAAKTAKGS